MGITMSINERLTSEEYIEQYIKSEHYKNAIFDSKIIDNFLSDDELNVFEKAAASKPGAAKLPPGSPPGRCICKRPDHRPHSGQKEPAAPES